MKFSFKQNAHLPCYCGVAGGGGGRLTDYDGGGGVARGRDAEFGGGRYVELV